MDWRAFAGGLAEMARELLAQNSVETTLERITASAVGLVPGCDAAGVLIVSNGKVRSLAPTEALVSESDRLQERMREGPCFDAAAPGPSEKVLRVADFAAPSSRWPEFVPAARALGLGSMMGFLLYTEDEELGALNLYSRRQGAFGDADETAGWALASHAAVALSSARTHAQLQEALSTRHIIGEAMGILMGRHHLTEEQAFDLLRRYSQEHNVKLREVARRVCETGGPE
jgi:GAF domain-containing protein